MLKRWLENLAGKNMFKGILSAIGLVLGAQLYADNVLLLTDIHFNPYAECTSEQVPCKTLSALIADPIQQWPNILAHQSVNAYKQDTDNAFFLQGLDGVVPIANSYETNTIFITGDLLAHHFNAEYNTFAPAQYNTQADLTRFSAKTIDYVLEQVQVRFPQAKIYMVLGNNDSDNGDYQMPSQAFLTALAHHLSQFVSNKTAFIASFSQGGYFSTPWSKDVELVGIDSNLLSAKSPDVTLATQQLQWLKQTLAQAKADDKKVIILQHIPYGMDLYQTATSEIPTPLLNPSLQAEYLQVLNQYATTISTIYAGHVHMEYFALVNHKTPLIGTIAFNSVFGNNPGFKIININQKGEFDGYTAYYANLATGKLKWTELYSFQKTYGNPANIVQILRLFPSNVQNPQVIAYRRYFNGDNPQDPQPISVNADWQYYYYGINQQRGSAFGQYLASL